MQSENTSDSRHPSATASRPRPGRPGIQLEDVLGAADALVAEGIKPTIERVRMRLGGGSPNTVSAHMDEWFARLPARLVGMQAPTAAPRNDDAPLSVVQAAQQFWDVARREANQMQVQKTEATRRELELERDALTQKEADVKQREKSFEDTRERLDDALASSQRALTAMEAQLQAQLQESTRMLGDSEAEVRRLRKAFDTAVATTEALREKSAMDLATAQRAARDAEERHIAQERRLLAEVDRAREEAKRANQAAARDQAALVLAGQQLAAVREQFSEELRAARAAAADARVQAEKHLAEQANILSQTRSELDHARTRLQESQALHEREMSAHEATRQLLQRAMTTPPALADKTPDPTASPRARSSRKRTAD
jgi:hypothetical protein